MATAIRENDATVVGLIGRFAGLRRAHRFKNETKVRLGSIVLLHKDFNVRRQPVEAVR
jgi:hypothetical protein